MKTSTTWFGSGFHHLAQRAASEWNTNPEGPTGDVPCQHVGQDDQYWTSIYIGPRRLLNFTTIHQLVAPTRVLAAKEVIDWRSHMARWQLLRPAIVSVPQWWCKVIRNICLREGSGTPC